MNKFYREVTKADVDGLDLIPAFDNDIGAKVRCKVMLDSPINVAHAVCDADGKVLAVAGGFFLYTRVMEVWTLVDTEALRQPVRYAQSMRHLLDHYFATLNLKRLQVIMKVSEEWAPRWAHFLGLQCEGVLRNYGEENVDYFLFSKVR